MVYLQLNFKSAPFRNLVQIEREILNKILTGIHDTVTQLITKLEH